MTPRTPGSASLVAHYALLVLHVGLFGELMIERDGRRVELPTRRHGRLLLAYLALNPGLHARASLSALLWPDVLDSSARSSLRSALTSVRRALGEHSARHLVAARDRIGLASEDLFVDVLRFRTLVRERQLEAGLELVTGELLQGFEEDWVYAAREQHRVELDAVMSTLAERAEQRGELTAAVEYTRRRVALDPLAEPPNRELMRMLAATGDRASALAVYTRLSERFQRELRALPSHDTRAAAAAIRGTRDGASRRPDGEEDQPLPLPIALQHAHLGPFAGRSIPVRTLTKALGQAREARRQIVLIGGEPGIGKTRLLAEFARGAHRDGTAVLFARCQREPVLPYEPFVEALRHYVGTSPIERLHRELPTLAGELRPLVPELDERAADLPLPLVGDPDGEENRVFRAMRATLLAASRARPLLLAVDDLQWADPPTVQLLEYLISAPEPARLLMLVAYRDAEGPELTQGMLRRARRLPEATALALQGLDARATAEVIRASHARDPAPALVAALQARTGGNPLFVEALLDRGLAASPAGDVVMAAGDAMTEPVLPERVTDLLLEEISTLSSNAREILAIASAVGEKFTYELVLRVASGKEETTLDALDEAVSARVIHELPEAVGRYAFRHALMRETVYVRLTKTRRAHLHHRVGQALDELSVDDPEPPLRQIAEQFLRAGSLTASADAAVHAARAAEEAARQHCHQDAASLYARAVHSLDGHRLGDRRLRCTLLCALGHAQRRAGAGTAVRSAFEEAAVLARSLEDLTMLAQAALGICSVPFFPGEDAIDIAAVDLLSQALELTPDTDRALRARLLAQLARELYFDTEREPANELARRALRLARESQNPAALGDAIDASHLLLTEADDAPQRLALADQMIELGQRHREVDILIRGRTRRAVHLLEFADLEAVAREGAQLEGIAEELGQPAYRWRPRLWQATEALLTGQLDEGERLAHQAFDLGAAAFGEAAELELHAQRFALQRQRDTIEELSSEAKKLATRYSFTPTWRCVQALIALKLDDLPTARSTLHELTRDGMVELRHDPAWLVAATLLAEVCTGVDDRDAARPLYHALAPHADRWAVTPSGSVCLDPVSRPLALLAATLDRPHDAERHLAHARTHAHAAGAKPLMARLDHEGAKAH